MSEQRQDSQESAFLGVIGGWVTGLLATHFLSLGAFVLIL